MSDALERAVERAQEQSEYLPGHYSGQGPFLRDGDSGTARIRTPRGRYSTRAMRSDMGLEFDEVQDLPDLSKIRTSSLSEEEKQVLLDQLLADHNTHTSGKRTLELESERIDLDHKKRFGNLGYSLGKWAAISLLFILLCLVGFLGYGIVFDKSLVETGVFSAFLSTTVEVIKAIFSVF